MTTLVGLRDRALIAVMTFAFARIGAVVAMRVEDYYIDRPRISGNTCNQVMVCPPLAESVDPVMKPASSAARNTTQRAISSGSPRRRTGICGKIDFSSTSLGDRLHHFGRDIAGADRVDGDALVGVLLRERLGEADIAGLRSGIIDWPIWPFWPLIEEMLMMRPNPRSRMPSITGRHMLNSEFRLVLMTCVPLVRRHLVEHAVLRDARVVDEHVDRAEVLLDLCQAGDAGLVIADVPFVDVARQSRP